MLFEDSSDKLRRNLITFSFIILISQIFEFKLHQEAKIFDFITLQLTSTFKLWMVVTSILFYFFFRFWFDKVRLEHWKYLTEEYEGIKVKTFAAFLKKELKAVLKHQVSSNVISHLDLDNHLEQAYRQSGKPDIVIVNLGFAPETEKSLGNGFIHINYSLVWKDGNRYARDGGNAVKFSLSTVRFWLKNLECMIRLLTLTKSNFDFIIPISLAGLSFLVCLKMLWNSLYF